MIMARKKRRAVLISVIAIIILIIIAIIISLYFLTDSFKPNKTLFAKYLVNAIPSIEALSNENHMEEMNQILENNKYESEIESQITYSKDNPINNVVLNVNSQIDKANNYAYRDIEIKQKGNVENSKLMKFEYINDNDIYGIRLDGINQFASTDLSKTNDEKNKALILDDVKNLDLTQYIVFTAQEKEQLKNTYLNIVNQNTTDNNYSKKKGQNVEINGKTYSANSYSLTLSKENMNNLYVEILNKLKEDEIVLNKLNNIDTKLNTYYELLENEQKSEIKNKFVKYIENQVKKIQDTNIGNEEKKITVYESKGQTISIELETSQSKYTINTVSSSNNTLAELKWSKIKENDNEKENSFNIKIEKNANINDESFNINYINIKDGEETSNEIILTRKFENNNVDINLEAERKNSNGDGRLEVKDKITIVNSFNNEVKLSEDNNIIIEDINDEQRNNINNTLNDNFNRQKELLTNVILKENFDNMLVELGLKRKQVEEITDDGNITETEKTRFNSTFELYQGEQIKKETILNLANIAKEHLENAEITKYKENSSGKQEDPLEYKLTILRNNKNEDIGNKLYNTINQSRDDEYNVKLEYDSETGLVSTIYISVYEKK